MTTYTNVIANKTIEASRLTARFDGVVDRKGRTFGAIAQLGTMEVRDATQAEKDLQAKYDALGAERYSEANRDLYSAICNIHFTNMTVGTHYSFRPCSTRDGAGYGASASTTYFATEAERDAKAAKYMKDAQKRAVKAAAKDLAKVRA